MLDRVMSCRDLKGFGVIVVVLGTLASACNASTSPEKTISNSQGQQTTATSGPAATSDNTPASVLDAAPAAAQSASPQQVLQAQVAELNQQLNSQPEYVLAPEDVELLTSEGALQGSDADTLKALVKL